jgi:predicted nucleotidyltransferase
MEQPQILTQLKQLASVGKEVVVMWLYGSRAGSMAHDNSDYDLAVAFNKPSANVLDNRLRPEVLAIKWQEIFSVDISILDINLALIPLAMSVLVDDTVLYGGDTLRRFKEEQRSMSMWELDYQYNRLNNA